QQQKDKRLVPQDNKASEQESGIIRLRIQIQYYVNEIDGLRNELKISKESLQRSRMSYNREEFIWTDALRLILIREVKRRPAIWSSESSNFNNMNDEMAFQITKKLHEVSTGICELTVNHIKDEWKAISNECIRVLSKNSEVTRIDSSIWRFGFALKFMLYAITHTEEGNAYVLLYVNKLNIFYVVRESDIMGVLWPFSNVRVQLKGKVEPAMIIEMGRLHFMIEKCRHLSISANSYIFPNNTLTEAHMLPNRITFDTRRYTGSLMRQNDEIVYYDSEDFVKKAKKAASISSISMRIADTGESKPFSSLQLLLQTRAFSRQTLFRGVPSSTLARADSELREKENSQLLLQSESLSSHNQLIPQRHTMTEFTEIQHDIDPTLSFGYSGIPTRITRQMEGLNFEFRRLLQSFDNIRYEASGLKQMISTAKRDIDKKLKEIALRMLQISQFFAPHEILTHEIEKEMKSVLVQTDETFDEEDSFSNIGKIYDDPVYRYCPKDVVDHLMTICSHPTVFARRLAQRIFTREEISTLFSEDVKINEMERIRWIEDMLSAYYPYKNMLLMKKSCLQVLFGMANYENLLLEIEKENLEVDSSGRYDILMKRMRLDDACSSTDELRNEKNEPKEDYLLPETLSRIKRQQPNVEGFAIKVAILLYYGDDDIRIPCKEKRDQTKLTWLKEKVQEFYPTDTVRNANYQWSRCLDALDTHANKLKIKSFDEYDSSDESIRSKN
ncbi:unnamed protein product, partial [Onchocerca ochengi]|uniref:MADF domain-containing protein n=1 Tax=Onchocerca ochengi TaxID=42157 RepID=A0A182EGD9_ONCOC